MTHHVGLVATASTTYNEPYHVAREFARQLYQGVRDLSMTRPVILWRLLPCLTALCATVSIASAETVLNVAASADLVTLDPTGTASPIVYTHGFLFYDTSFAPDEELGIRPQMVGDEAVSAGKLSYTLTLRPGLTFHDGSLVTARDVIASLQRWMSLDIVGRTMAVDVQSMTAMDANTFTIALKRRFPVEQALANSGSGLPVILREKETSAGPIARNTAVIGSGPFRFVADAWRPGDKAVYEWFAGYVPRNEPPNGLAGGTRSQYPPRAAPILPAPCPRSASPAALC